MDPEFEELRRQFKKQFKQVPAGTFKRIFAGIIVAAVVILLLTFGLSSYYTIDTEEVGVVLRLGKFKEITRPGLHFKLPVGIDRVYPVPVERTFKEEFGFRTVRPGVRTEYSRTAPNFVLTGDLGIVDVEWIVQYRIRDPEAYLFNIKDTTRTIRDVSETVMRLEIGDSSIEEVITSRKEIINMNVKAGMQKMLDAYGAGIYIVTVKLQDVNPPPEVKDSFDEVNRAIQEKETKINEARREWNKEIPSATGKATQMVQSADGYRLKRVNEAKGDVARFSALRAEYEKAKEVTRARLYLEMLEDVVPRMSQIYVVDGKQAAPLQVLDLKETAAAARRARETEGASRSKGR